MTVSIVIPALNEEDAITQTVKDVQKTLSDANIVDFEVLVVDDGSTDATAERAVAAGAHVVKHVHNLGYGRSLKTGIAAAQNDTIVISDADGTYPIVEIPRLVEIYSKGYDMVVAQRTGEHYHESAIKSRLRGILRGIVEFFAERPVLDVNSGLRVFSRRTIQRYVGRLCDTFSFTTSVTLAYMMTGKTVVYIPCDYHSRIGQTKVKMFKDTVKTFQYILQAAIYYNPLRLFALASFFTIALGAVLMIISLAFGGLTSFFALSLGSILLGITFFVLGLIADLLRQGFDTLEHLHIDKNDRPN
jgi:glycosyltransferase involved in cell wall biosynthesis